MNTATKRWKQQLQYELQGAPYESLIDTTGEVSILPFYTSENVKHSYPISVETQIAVPLFVSDKEQTLQRIALWESCKVDTFALTLHPKQNKKEVTEWLPPHLNFVIEDDFLAASLSKGDFLSPQFPFFSPYEVDSTLYANAGASKVQQLSFAVAHLQEYSNTLKELGFLQGEYFVKIAIGDVFLLEIAKLRALRRLLSEYFPAQTIRLVAEVSHRGLSLLKSAYNEHYTSIACEAAILGGADYWLAKPNTFFKKQPLAQMQNDVAKCQEILHKRKAAQANGAYAVDTLSDELYKKTYLALQQIEKAGGWRRMVERGSLQYQIKMNAQEEQSLFDTEWLQNLEATLGMFLYTKKDWDFYPFLSPLQHKALFAPLRVRRLWEPLEKKLLRSQERMEDMAT